MGGFLIGTALLSMAYVATNLRLMGFYPILVLTLISIAISTTWLVVAVRVGMLNDKCSEYLRLMERTPGKYVGIAQSLMNLWAGKTPISRYAVRLAFCFVVAAIIFAWVALLCIKLFSLT